MLVVAAAAGLAVKEPAADVGIGSPVVFLLFELIEAALAAAVAKAFPLRIRHLRQRLPPPEWNFVGRRVLSCHHVLPRPTSYAKFARNYHSPCGYPCIGRCAEVY